MKTREFVLDPQETLLWEGQPVAWKVGVSYAALPAFGVVWMIVAYKLGAEVWEHPQPGLILMFLVVAAVTVVALSAPFYAWWGARRTRYFLTNQRAVVLDAGSKAESFRVADWRLEVVRMTKNAGSINFAKFGMGARLGFKCLADLSVVEPVVQRLASSRGVAEGH